MNGIRNFLSARTQDVQALYRVAFLVTPSNLGIVLDPKLASFDETERPGLIPGECVSSIALGVVANPSEFDFTPSMHSVET